MKKLLILFLSFVLGISSFAQKIISGKVLDSNNSGVASASVTIEEPGKSTIIAYGISDAKGYYKISFSSPEEKVVVKAKAFNQKTIVKTVNNASQNLDFQLQSEVTEIKEVNIKTKLITKRGDTISYDLKSFESKNDRVLADVLKKLPGIEVNKDGTVLYQGEAINKFYVNGKDLMEGGYGTINNSLPKDAIAKVEVMENHQPLKILQDKIPSEKAALNIKLKKAVTMTGRAELGAGFLPLLWNAKVSPMLFTEKYQWVLNYKSNNTGESVENEGNMLAFGNRFEGMRRSVSQSKWVSVENASVPNLPEKRYLMNNIHYFSANLLTNLNKEWEFKANASYANNAVERKSYVATEYPTGVAYIRDISNHFYTNQAKGEFIFTKNAKKGFFKNTTTWNGFWNNDRADAYRVENTNRFAGESLNSPTGSFQNSLSTIIPFKEKLINFMSYFYYKKDRQTLISSPASYSYTPFFNLGNFDKLKQDFDLNTLEVNHSASVGFTYKKWTITPEMGLNLSMNRMNSTLLGISGLHESSFGSHFSNSNTWNQVLPYTQIGINYRGENFNLSFNLPMNFYGISFKDNIGNFSKNTNKMVFEPSIFANYEFASFWKLNAFAGINYNFGSINSIYRGAILSNPTSVVSRFNPSDPAFPMPETIAKNIGSRLEYRNPLNNLFFNIRYSYGTSSNNTITKMNVSSAGNLLELIAQDNFTTSQSESAEVGKYFPKAKTNASLSFTNRDSNYFSFYNELVENKNNAQTLNFKLNNTFFKWMSVDYNISFTWNKNKNNLSSQANTSSGWSHNLSSFFYPIEDHTIGFNWDDINSTLGNQSYRNAFYDLSYQYTWAKKKIDFELKWLNIANKKVYENISRSADNTVTKTVISIRPSQLMFTVKFNFR